MSSVGRPTSGPAESAGVTTAQTSSAVTPTRATAVQDVKTAIPTVNTVAAPLVNTVVPLVNTTVLVTNISCVINTAPSDATTSIVSGPLAVSIIATAGTIAVQNVMITTTAGDHTVQGTRASVFTTPSVDISVTQDASVERIS